MSPRSTRRSALGPVLFAIGLAAGCGDATRTSTSSTPGPRIDLSQPWAEAAPADLGMDAAGLASGEARAAAVPRFRSLLAARHGRLVLERYFHGTGEGTLFDVRSVTKSVISALVGIALRDQAFPGLDVPVAAYLEPAYALDEADRGVTLRHLLTMTSGFRWDEGAGPDYNLWILADDHVQYLLDRPHVHPPGDDFTYDSAAVHTLGVALQRAAGTSLSQYGNDRLFEPLGATSVGWEALDRGTVNGGSGIRLRGRDLLKLGQLFLQRGWSGEKSLVPESWVQEVTAPHFPWRDTHGMQQRVTYGMLWWVSDGSPAAFFAWGYGGQFVYVVPSLDLVVVTTTDWSGLTETTPEALAQECFGVIVGEILPAAR